MYLNLFLSLFCFFSLNAFQHNGKPSEALIALCKDTNLSHNKTLESINAAAQDENSGWIRKPGKERWEIENKFEQEKKTFLANLAECGLVNEQLPQQKSYDYVLIMGALEKTMQKRISYLENLVKNGKVTAKQIILFGGHRPTNPQLENSDLGKTEAEIFENIYKKSSLKNHPYTLVVAPMKKDAQGKEVRPNTDDTIYAWLASNPKPGTALVISSQPYVARQALVVKTLLPSEFSIDAAGPVAAEQSISVYLDELARTIYQQLRLDQRTKK